MPCFCGGCTNCLHDQGLDCERPSCDACGELRAQVAERERIAAEACPGCGEENGGARHGDCREEAPPAG